MSAKIIKKINDAQNDNRYENILREVIKHCHDELEDIYWKKKEIQIKSALLDSKYNNDEFAQMFEHIKILNYDHERADYHVIQSTSIKIGNITFHRTYDGDNEGNGDYYCEVRFSGINALIGEEVSWEEMAKLSYSNEDYGTDLLDIYKGNRFKNITKDTFIKYVSYVITTIMDKQTR